jgi:site-specific recombinase XerD
VSPAPEEFQAVDRLTLTPLIRKYIRGRVDRREIEPITADRHRHALVTFAESFGGRQVKMMGRADIERWVASRGKNSVATRRLEMSTVRGFVRWLQVERIIKSDPMVSVKSPKPARRVPRALTRPEVEALCAVLPDARARAIVALMLGAGLRRCEVIRLQVGDWDRHAQTIQVRGKGGHERHVPVTAHVAEALGEYIGGARLGPMIRSYMNDASGLSTSSMTKLMRGWMVEAGVKHAPWDGKAGHALRHTVASDVADVEPDLRVVQEMLGHASLSSTQIYLRHAGLGRVRAAMDAANPSSEPVELTLEALQRRMAAMYWAISPRTKQQFLADVAAALDRAELAHCSSRELPSKISI